MSAPDKPSGGAAEKDWTLPYRRGEGHCGKCGGDNAEWLSDAEGAYCRDCGSSDEDE